MTEPVVSSADGPDSFWFSCAPTARRAANLAVNPRLVVAVDDTVEVVSVEGVARCVPGTDPHAAAAIDSYVAKYWPGEDPEPHAGFLRSHEGNEVCLASSAGQPGLRPVSPTAPM